MRRSALEWLCCFIAVVQRAFFPYRTLWFRPGELLDQFCRIPRRPDRTADPVEELFDEITGSIEISVEADRLVAVAFLRDIWPTPRSRLMDYAALARPTSAHISTSACTRCSIS